MIAGHKDIHVSRESRELVSNLFACLRVHSRLDLMGRSEFTMFRGVFELCENESSLLSSALCRFGARPGRRHSKLLPRFPVPRSGPSPPLSGWIVSPIALKSQML